MDALLSAGFSLSEAGRLYVRHFEDHTRRLALDFTQSRALIVLSENEGVTQQRLSELTAIASPWLIRTLDRLQAIELTLRRPRSADLAGRTLLRSRRTHARYCRCCGTSWVSRSARHCEASR
jgi:DNA-binding MarR family transcriptional regulator